MKRKREINYYGPNKFRFPRTDWCGPGWSDGKWQDSVCGYSTARSRFDQACKEHDCDISKGDEEGADWRFLRDAPNKLIGIAPLISHKLNNIMNKFTQTGRKRSDSSSSMMTGLTDYTIPRSIQNYGVGSMTRIVPRKMGRMKKGVKGVMYMYENGGVISETNTTAGQPISQVLYIGHTTLNRDRASLAIWAAILKRLIQKAGIDVPTLVENVFENTNSNNSYVIDVQYAKEGLAGLQTANLGVNTINVMATTAYQSFDTIGGRPLFKAIYLRDTNDATQTKVAASLNLERLIVHLGSSTTLSIQNTTPADSSVLSTDNVGSNPLKGKLYQCNYASFQVATTQKQKDPLFNSSGLGIAGTSQVLGFLNQNNSLEVEQRAILAEVPSPLLVYKCTKTAPVYMLPGAMVKSRLYYKTDCYLNTWYDGFLDSVAGTANQQGDFGKCAVFALDKTLDSRKEKTPPLVTYQIDCDYTCKISSKKLAPTVPYKEIQADTY